jgi:hypothetical protein
MRDGSPITDRLPEMRGRDTPDGCAFVLDISPAERCNAPPRPGSSYCEEHHTLCHLPSGSPGERRKLHEIEALAQAAGGRLVQPATHPGNAELLRLERSARALSRRKRSRIVPNSGDHPPLDATDPPVAPTPRRLIGACFIARRLSF